MSEIYPLVLTLRNDIVRINIQCLSPYSPCIIRIYLKDQIIYHHIAYIIPNIVNGDGRTGVYDQTNGELVFCCTSHTYHGNMVLGNSWCIWNAIETEFIQFRYIERYNQIRRYLYTNQYIDNDDVTLAALYIHDIKTLNIYMIEYDEVETPVILSIGHYAFEYQQREDHTTYSEAKQIRLDKLSMIWKIRYIIKDRTYDNELTFKGKQGLLKCRSRIRNRRRQHVNRILNTLIIRDLAHLIIQYI